MSHLTLDELSQRMAHDQRARAFSQCAICKGLTTGFGAEPALSRLERHLGPKSEGFRFIQTHEKSACRCPSRGDPAAAASRINASAARFSN